MREERIVTSINNLKSMYDVSIDEEKDTGEKIYNITAASFRVIVTINPNSWLGAEIQLLDSTGKNRLHYSIDTDNYPIAQPKYIQFANDIEDEIVNLLMAIKDKKISIAIKNNRYAMIIPQNKGVLLIKNGLFFTSTNHYNDRKKAESWGDFIFL